MPVKDSLSLLIGNFWIPDSQKVDQLQKKYSLPKTKLSTLVTEQPTDIGKYEDKPLLSSINIIEKPDTSITTKALPTLHESKSDDNLSTTFKSPEVADGNTPAELITKWHELVTNVQNCKKCKLCYGRTHVVIERGSRQAKWMFIGEGPGEQEDLQGKPFVGASGQLLDKMIAAMNLDSQVDIYITNVVKCRPPHNRNPEEDEINACNSYLQSQIKMVNPQIIITLGRYAAQTILSTDIAVGKLRNKVHDYNGIPVIVTYHPSYLLRTPTAKKDAWADLQLAMKTKKPA